MLLEVTATDSRGLKDTKTVRLDPQTVNLTVDSEPAGLQLNIDEESRTGPNRPRDHRRRHDEHLRGVAPGRGQHLLRLRLVV